jgi:hypothetical protein
LSDQSTEKKSTNSEEELMKECREDFRYHKEYWRENHEQSEKDMQTVACMPPPDFTADRKGRPCIWPDETSQYVKQCNNNLRQNKRAAKISPRSEDATDKDAEHRQAYLRGIEYASKAQGIYTSAFESAVECAMGYWRVTLRVTGPNGEQEPRLSRIPNQFSCFPDPDAIEPDFSDSNTYFVLCPPMRQKVFAQRYPKAKKQSFTAEDQTQAPDWFSGDNITTAEWWKRRKIETKDGQDKYEVTQRIVNGIEVLETNQWIGSKIPIIGVFGEEIYVKTGGQVKRVFMSLIRRARDLQTMLAYIASQEAEEFGMAPRAPLQGYKGQFDSTQHSTLHKVPVAYAEFKVPLDWNASWGPPPLPTRMAFTPNYQAYEVAYERYRRGVQAAMGIGNLPTAAQRQNEKSGKALERIENQQAVGSFHFTDNFTRSLANSSAQINELITKLAELDSLPQQLLGKDKKGEDVILKVAARDQQANAEPDSEHLPEDNHFFAHRGQFELAISDGSNYLSQREEESEFAETLIANLPKMGLPPQITQQLTALAVKLKNLGPIGDEIADLLSPPDPSKLDPKTKAILAQAQGQVQMLQQELQKMLMEREADVIKNQAMLQGKQMDNETKLAIAEISTKAQQLSERFEFIADLVQKLHVSAHEAGMQAQEHDHAHSIADKQAAAAQQQQATQISADQASQGADQAHQQQMAEQAAEQPPAE